MDGSAGAAGSSELEDLERPELYLNRELSWLEFNQHVLDEARDDSVPLLERLKFLSIAQTNLDEFLMVRVAGLQEQYLEGVGDRPADGMTPAEQLAAISDRMERMYDDLSGTFLELIVPRLQTEGVELTTPGELPEAERRRLHRYFQE